MWVKAGQIDKEQKGSEGIPLDLHENLVYGVPSYIHCRVMPPSVRMMGKFAE